MAVTRATFARSVTYTVSDRPDPEASSFEARYRYRQRKRDMTSAMTRTMVQSGRKKSGICTQTESFDPRAGTECGGCRIEMEIISSASGNLHYLICPKCRARFASNYSEVIQKDTVIKQRTNDSVQNQDYYDRLRIFKERAMEFHRRLDESDPYCVLGLKPGTPIDQVRSHYRELAACHHPDHGGDPKEMRRIINAYDKIRRIEAKKLAY